MSADGAHMHRVNIFVQALKITNERLGFSTISESTLRDIVTEFIRQYQPPKGAGEMIDNGSVRPVVAPTRAHLRVVK